MLTRRKRSGILYPGWLPQGMTVGVDFANNRGHGGLREAFYGPLLTCTRSSTADYIDDLSGRWRTFPANVPRTSNRGLLLEAAATNVAIWCRDLTNVAWAKVSMAAALTQTGIDGTANSATRITATGANATILQTDVLGSSSRRASVFVRRATGTGTIQFTGDGATFTTVTVTSDWSRVSLAAATVVNPVTGFKIVTSGDEIDVDFVQNETGPAVTSPILTTTVAVTRSADVCKFAFVPHWFNPLEGTLFAEAVCPNVNTGTIQTLVSIDDNSTNNRIQLRESAASGAFIVVSGAATQASMGTTSFAANTPFRLAGAYASNSFNMACNGGISALDTAGTVPTPTQVNFGQNSASALQGYLRKFAYGPRRLPDFALGQMTFNANGP